MKDLIIGAASNYTWNQLKYWVNSIRETSFKGDIVVVGRNIDDATIKELTDRNVKVQVYQGDSSLAPHVEKFFFVWDFLNKSLSEYRNVLVTDTRDVILQENPFESHLIGYSDSKSEIIIDHEGLVYSEEPWGLTNYMQAFGPYFYDRVKDKMIYNVGVLGGTEASIKNLMMMIFQLSFNRPIKVCDQASLNFLVHESTVFKFDRDENTRMAIHLGTSPLAVEAGSGDLGVLATQNPEVMKRYKNAYTGPFPDIENGLVVNDAGYSYCVVHQWDRVPEIKKLVEEKYGS